MLRPSKTSDALSRQHSLHRESVPSRPIKPGPSGSRLLDEAEVGGERIDLVRPQRAGNHRHRRLWSRMISLAPFLEPPLQVEIRQPSETRNLSYALATRATASTAGHK